MLGALRVRRLLHQTKFLRSPRREARLHIKDPLVATITAVPRKSRASSYAPKLEVSPMKSIMVFSHLRWDFVYQRPQHLMMRLAEYYRIFFIEELVLDRAASFMEV